MAESSEVKSPITPADIEAKLRHLVGDVEETTGQVRNTAVAAGAALVVLLVLLAFLSGRKRGIKGSTVVEIRRI